MSAHHRRQQWSTHAPKHRARIEATLPAPCVECGRPVNASDPWQVGHRTPAALGGKPTAGNVGPVHTPCNRKAGGRLGARIVNSRKQASKDIRPW